MSPRLRRLMVLSLVWLPLAVGAQSPVDGAAATASEAEPDVKAGSLAFIAGFDTLFRLDLSTGAGTAVGTGFGFTGGAQIADMDSIAFAPDGTLYGVADSPRAALYRLSTASGRATLVAQFRENGQLIDNNTRLDGVLGFTCSGKLLMAARGLGRLFEVDPATAAVRAIGPFDLAVGGLATRGSDVLALGIGGSEGIYRLSESGAEASRMPSALAARSYPGGAMAFAADGRLFAAIDNGRQAPPVLLELTPDGSSILRETTITGAQFGTAANSQPVRTLAIAPPVCAAVGGGASAVAVPALDPRGLLLLSLLLVAGVLRLRRRPA